MNQAFVLLGTNLGNKELNLIQAIEQIVQRNIKVLLKSGIYKTAAWGNTNQDDFYNQVIKIETNFSASDLLGCLLNIETSMGRIRNKKWEARIIDLDILYFNNDIIDTEILKIPHPYLHVRRFTLEPLVEIASNFLHPIFNKTNTELLVTCSDSSKVERVFSF